MKKLLLFLLSFLILGQSCIFSQTCNAETSLINDDSKKINNDKRKIVGSVLKNILYTGVAVGTGGLSILFYKTNTAKPQDTAKPQNTAKPQDTAKPQNIAKPQDTAKPQNIAKPQQKGQQHNIKLFGVPENLKVIHWQDNLCWFNTTILMFYYHPIFCECILSFPVKEAEEILTSSKNLNPKEREDLEAFIELSKTFCNINSCSGNVYTMPNRDLFNKLNNAIKLGYNMDSNGNYKQCEITYGEPGNVFPVKLYELINRVINYTMRFNSLKQWGIKSSDNINKLYQGMHVHSLSLAFKNAGIKQCENENGGGHFWVKVNRYNALWDIGHNIHDNNSIERVTK